MFNWPPKHRPPCGGWKEKLEDAVTIGHPRQHYDDRHERIRVIKNITQSYPAGCTPECCDPSTRPEECDVDCCPPEANCPDCSEGEKTPVQPAPRVSCRAQELNSLAVDNLPVSGTGCAYQWYVPPGIPCGPFPGTLGYKYSSGNCAPATLPEVPCGYATTKVGDNCFKLSDPPEYVNLAKCDMTGYKLVIAGKNWHGMRPFGLLCSLSEADQWQDLDCQTCFSSDNNPYWQPWRIGLTCGSKPYSPVNNASRKYCSVAVEYTSTSRTIATDMNETSQTYSGVNTVDPLTGRRTRNGSGSVNSIDIRPDLSTYGEVSEDSEPPAELTTHPIFDECMLPQSNREVNSCNRYSAAGRITVTRSEDTLYFKFVESGDTAYRVRFRCEPSEEWAYQWVNDAGLASLQAEEEAGCDTGPFHLEVLEARPLGLTVEITWTLGLPYTSVEVMGHIQAAQDTWNLKDHALYPPRTDAVTNGGPLVTYNERNETEPGMDWFDSTTELPWTDPIPPRYPTRAEGEIVGGPSPLGTDKYFDYYHTSWILNDDPLNDYGYSFPNLYGQWSDQAHFKVPHMTQWTDERHHAAFPHGAFVYCAGINGASLYFPHMVDNEDDGPSQPKIGNAFFSVIASKYAEVAMFDRKPYNFARPCGEQDVAALDMDTVDCEAEDPLADALPRFPDAKCDCDDDAFLGHVVSINVTGPSDPIEIVLDDDHDLSDGQIINVCGVEGCTNANGKRSVLVTGADKFKLFDSDSPETPITSNGDYTQNGNVTRDTTGEEKYWNDIWNKGSVVVKDWWYDFRGFLESMRVIQERYDLQKDATERAEAGDPCAPVCSITPEYPPVRFTVLDEAVTDDCTTFDSGQIFQTGDELSGGSKWLSVMNAREFCVQHSPCTPCIVYVQPHASNQGINHSDVGVDVPFFGDTNFLDFMFGTMWISRVEQWTTSPLWKLYGNGYELLKCDVESTKVEDDGSCHTNCEDCVPPIAYYPQREYVEGIAIIPPDAPPLPTDAREIGCPDFIARLNGVGSPPPMQDAAPGLLECASPYNFWIDFVPNIHADDNPCLRGTYVIYAGRVGGSLGFGEDYPVQAPPFTPWVWKINLDCNVAAGSCRFSSTYLGYITEPDSSCGGS